MTDKGYYMPETKEEAVWEIVGRVNAAHDYLLCLAQKRSASEFYAEALPDECRIICGVLGFADVLAITKEGSRS